MLLKTLDADRSTGGENKKDDNFLETPALSGERTGLNEKKEEK